MKNKKKVATSNISERDKKLLFILGAILVLAGAYFFVFRTYTEKTDEYVEKNQNIENYIKELDSKIANKEIKEKEIITYNTERRNIVDRFSGGMTHELAIKLLADMEKETEITTAQVNLSVNDIFFNQKESEENQVIKPESVSSVSSIAVEGVSEENYPMLTGYKTSLTLEFACTDEQLRKAIDFVNNYEEKMSVESVVVGYDETTGGLIGTMVVCMYALDGNDKEYEEPMIDNVKSGVVNIFSQKSSVNKKSK